MKKALILALCTFALAGCSATERFSDLVNRDEPEEDSIYIERPTGTYNTDSDDPAGQLPVD